MKKVLVFLALFSVLLLNSCSKDNALSPSTYSNVKITEIAITQLPMKTPDGSSWDILGGNPDPYLDFSYLSDATHKSILKSDTYNDVTSTMLPLKWTITGLGGPIADQSFQININDEDTTTPDLMGVATLKLSQYTTYPTKVVLSNTNNTIQMEITLSWY